MLALCDMTNLTSLTLKGCPNTFLTLPILLTALSRMPNMTTLNLPNWRCNSETQAIYLRESLSKMHNMTSLNLSGAVDSKNFHIFSAALTHMSMLKELDIALYFSDSPIDVAGVFAPVLARMTRLTTLNLKNHRFRTSDACHVASALTHLTHMRSLDLERATTESLPNPATTQEQPAIDCALKYFGVAFAAMKQLTMLDISSNWCDVETAKEIGLRLQSTKLTSLNISTMKFSSEAAGHLMASLSQLNSLKSLKFNRNYKLDVADKIKAISFLGTMPNLTKLDLSSMLHEGAPEELHEVLRAAVAQLPNLKALEMDGSYLGVNGLQNLCVALEKTTLRLLILSNVRLNNEAPSSCAYLARLKHLESFNISGWSLTNEHRLAFCDAATQLPNLRKLSMNMYASLSYMMETASGQKLSHVMLT